MGGRKKRSDVTLSAIAGREGGATAVDRGGLNGARNTLGRSNDWGVLIAAPIREPYEAASRKSRSGCCYCVTGKTNTHTASY